MRFLVVGAMLSSMSPTASAARSAMVLGLVVDALAIAAFGLLATPELFDTLAAGFVAVFPAPGITKWTAAYDVGTRTD